MKLTWHGHSCFTIHTGGETLILDPYRDDVVPGLAPLRVEGDQVYCSHEHRDHGALEVCTLSGKDSAVQVETIQTYHDDTQGSQRGENTIHIFSAEGLRVAHMGDLGCELTPGQKEQLQNLDAILIPVGGFYTIDAKQAQALIQSIQPRVVVPMHYRSDSFGFDVIAHLDDFLALRSDVIRHSSNTLELTKDTPAQTAVLTYQGH